MLNKIEIFKLKSKTKNNIDIHVCGMCQNGFTEIAISAYRKAIEEAIFPETKDIYLVDYILNGLIVKASVREVIAVGASISVGGLNERSGGIIGNPFSAVESAEEEIEDWGNGLYCIAFSGRFGAVFLGNTDTAIVVKEKFTELSQFGNMKAVKEAEAFLKRITDLYIVVSDGSGEGGYLYAAAYKK